MAGAVIDSMVLELGLDASKFSEGQQEAITKLRDFETQARRSGGVIEDQGKRVLDTFQAFRREALVGLGVFFGGKETFDAINHIMTMDAATGRLARTMDVSTQDLSAWKGAVTATGGSAESANAAISGLSDALGQFDLTKRPQEWMMWARRAGVNVFDQSGHVKDSIELLKELGDAVQGMKGREATALLEKIPGMNRDMINFLITNRQWREETLASFRAMAPTQAEQDAAQAYTAELAELDASATNLSRTLVYTLGPALTKIMDMMTHFLRSFTLTPPEAANLDEKFKNDLGAKLGSSGSFWRWAAKTFPNNNAFPLRMAAEADAEASEGSGAGATRGDRNNNPGNIVYGPWAAAHGASGSDGHFAIFPTLEVGQSAMDALLASGSYSGLTLSQLQQKWVGNADPNYLGGLESATGLAGGDVPNLSDPSVRSAIERGISRGEGTHIVSAAALASGVSRSMPAAAAPGSTGNPVTVTVGNVYVNAPQAKDSPSAAAEVGPALQRSIKASAANYSQQ
jgi:hypothetical protein